MLNSSRLLGRFGDSGWVQSQLFSAPPEISNGCSQASALSPVVCPFRAPSEVASRQQSVCPRANAGARSLKSVRPGSWSRGHTLRRYLSPEPLLQSPTFTTTMAARGMQVLTYAYAANNPLRYTDVTGNSIDPICVLRLQDTMMRRMRSENLKGQDKWYHCMTTCLIANLCASTSAEGTLWALAVGAGAEAVDVLIKLYVGGHTLGGNISDGAADMDANLHGLGYGLGHGGFSCDEKCTALDKRSCARP